MITITGLTVRQKTIMDLLWGCASIEDVNRLIAALPTATDQQDARGLLEVAMMATLEAEGELDAHKTAAQDAIARAMLR